MKIWLRKNLIYILSIALVIFIIGQTISFLVRLYDLLGRENLIDIVKIETMANEINNSECSLCSPTSTDNFCKVCLKIRESIANTKWDLSD